ncbi:MAG: hypothetical protein HOM21_09850 [Halobacteriovoraceae bacterium]|nr:hypothetical protein [Halobacteriovoraceae bacterium]
MKFNKKKSNIFYMAILYHYVHCPYCIRVRMALGHLEVDYQSVVVPYHDEDLPNKLCGKKMLPIFEFPGGGHSNESLLIIERMDEKDRLNCDLLESHKSSLDHLTDRLGAQIHSLCMPYWAYTPEFNPQSRHYFQQKKEVKRGPFNKLIQNKQQYLDALAPLLEETEKLLTPYYAGESLSILDIMLASHLWGLYIFPEFQFSDKLHSYLRTVKEECHFEYHQDFWV